MKKLISVISAAAVCLSLVCSPVYAGEPKKAEINTAALVEAMGKLTKDIKSVDSIESAELKLSRPTDDELKELAKFYKTNDVGYFLRNSDKELTEQEAFTDLKRYDANFSVTYVVKDSDKNLVGAVILTCLGENVVNVAYWILPEFRGHSYASKACELVIREIHKKNSKIVFVIGMDQENHSSVRVAEKLKASLLAENDGKICYDVIKDAPFKIKYKIQLVDEKEEIFKCEQFVNDVRVGVSFCKKSALEYMTYKKIFEKNELEIVRYNYYVVVKQDV